MYFVCLIQLLLPNQINHYYNIIITVILIVFGRRYLFLAAAAVAMDTVLMFVYV